MRPEHIERVLIFMHPGQWFTWSDYKNKVYENLVILDASKEKPTKEFLESELATQQAAYDAQEYGRNRAIAYPRIQDQLDMLWHAVDTGDWTAAKVKTTSFYTELKAVKDANPKP